MLHAPRPQILQEASQPVPKDLAQMAAVSTGSFATSESAGGVPWASLACWQVLGGGSCSFCSPLSMWRSRGAPLPHPQLPLLALFLLFFFFPAAPEHAFP